MNYLIPLLTLISFPAFAATEKNPALIDVQKGVVRAAPAELSLAAYQAWVTPLLREADAWSAFAPKVFDWYQNEKDRGLPREVYSDPQRIYVNVKRPLEETIDLENSGEITEGNTIGAEVYAEQAGTVAQALDTMLFRWGKPVRAWEGRTYPPGGQFQKRVDYFAPNPEWGPQAFASLTLRRNGGLIQDLFDRYIVLIRGDDRRGFDVLMQYLKPGGTTPTEKCIAIAIIRPLSDGKVAYKISTRFQGQSYKVLGNVQIGRDQIGFNASKVRAVQVESNGLLKELQENGIIKDRKTDIGFDR